VLDAEFVDEGVRRDAAAESDIVDAEVLDDGPGSVAQVTGESGARARIRRLPAVPLLAAALVVLTGLAVFFAVRDAALRGTPAATNTALVDVGATAEAAGQLSDALETVYSFDFARLDENERAAREVITPEFAAGFDRLSPRSASRRRSSRRWCRRRSRCRRSRRSPGTGRCWWRSSTSRPPGPPRAPSSSSSPRPAG
jgi:hypothetical protein